MIKKFTIYILTAFDTHSKGASARKLSAFAVMICVVVAHIAWIKNCFSKNDFSLLEGILIIDYAFVGGLLGLTTYESIKKHKDEKTNIPASDTPVA